MAALHELSIQELGAKIRIGQISPVEVTRACLTRIRTEGTAVNAFITGRPWSMILRVSEAILIAIALKFAVLPLLGWGGSLLALRGSPSGSRSVVGVGCALVGALASFYFARVFGFGEIGQVAFGAATLALVIAHVRRYVLARRLRRSPESPPPS